MNEYNCTSSLFDEVFSILISYITISCTFVCLGTTCHSENDTEEEDRTDKRGPDGVTTSTILNVLIQVKIIRDHSMYLLSFSKRSKYIHDR